MATEPLQGRHLAVANGIPTNVFSPVVSIYLSSGTVGRGCTRTLIPPGDVVLFAAHCVCDAFGSKDLGKNAVIEISGVDVYKPIIELHPG